MWTISKNLLEEKSIKYGEAVHIPFCFQNTYPLVPSGNIYQSTYTYDILFRKNNWKIYNGNDILKSLWIDKGGETKTKPKG